ncbi:hypothetical protein B0H34DRAFT_52167 [Crassisporium funariophilum]|nr:hypothetical protein B0H34DRAFT_52167 [Crassisporium funariophilum]
MSSIIAESFQALFSSCFGQSGQNIHVYEPIGSNAPTRQSAIGVVRVVIQSANIKERFWKPRPFVRIRVRGRKETQATKWEQKTLSPNWLSESTHILVYSLSDILEFEVLNHHRLGRPGLIGFATFSLNAFEMVTSRVGVEETIRKQDVYEVHGSLLFDVFYHPVISLNEKSLWDVSNTGIVTLQVQRAKNLEWRTSLDRTSKIVASISLGWAQSPIYQTDPGDHHLDPLIWDSHYEFLCVDRASTVIVVQLITLESKNVQIYGHVSIPLDDLLTAQDSGNEWWPLSGCSDGHLLMTANWKPLDVQ